MLHEDGFLAVNLEVTVVLHPRLDVHMPLYCRQPSRMHTLHKLQCVTILHLFLPPILQANVNLLITHITIQELLLGVGLE